MVAVALFTFSTGVTRPISPLFAAGLGISVVYIGALNSIGVTANAVAHPLSGRLSDRRGRAVLMAGGLGALAAGNAVYAITRRPLAVLLLTGATVLIGVGAASFWPALKATVVERYPSRRERAFGYITAVQAGATAFGAAVGGVMASAVGYRWAFGASTACLVVALLLVLATPLTRPSASLPPVAAMLGSHKTRSRHRPNLGLLAGVALVGFVNAGVGAILTFLSLYAAQVYHVSAAVIGLLFTAIFLGQGAGAFAVGRLADHRLFAGSGSGLLLRGELILGAAVVITTPFMPFGAFVATQTLLALLLSAALVGLYARTTELVSTRNLGATIGTVESIGMAALLLGPLLGGVVFRFDRELFFPACGLLFLSAAVTLTALSTHLMPNPSTLRVGR